MIIAGNDHNFVIACNKIFTEFHVFNCTLGLILFKNPQWINPIADQNTLHDFCFAFGVFPSLTTSHNQF